MFFTHLGRVLVILGLILGVMMILTRAYLKIA